MNDALFKEVECYQTCKAGETACGDAFLSHRDRDTDRVVSVLSDGLGSGVKANILSSMTAKMALKFAQGEIDAVRSARIMMEALPVCAVRKIGYATYTVVDCRDTQTVRIIEQGNPGFVLIREGRLVEPPGRELQSSRAVHRRLRITECKPQPEDRLVFFSDGVTEAGMGSPGYKLGWRRAGVIEFLLRTLRETPGISARELARRTVQAAVAKEPDRRAGDDTTCAAVYMRRPRRTLLLSGPPFRADRDGEYAAMAETFDGRTVICGGTSAAIISRELNRPLETPLRQRSSLPPISYMAGIDLVTEGILTLTETHRRLELATTGGEDNAAGKLVELLRESDIIDIVVGTRINEAHQDPSLPVDLEIRRNLLNRMKQVLERNYLKAVTIRYL